MPYAPRQERGATHAPRTLPGDRMRPVKEVMKMVATELRRPWSQTRLRDRVWALRRGFHSHVPALIEDIKARPELYISNLERGLRLQTINGHYGPNLNDKLTTHWLLESRRPGIRPELVAIVEGGRLCPLVPPDRAASPSRPTDLYERLEEGQSFVAKPVVGSKGRGMYVIEDAKSLEALTPQMSRHMLEVRVGNAAYAESIFPQALNTMRVLTIVDEDGGHVMRAVHRFGTQQSAPADNLSAGGVCAPIDVEMGTMGAALGGLGQTSGGGPNQVWAVTHPDTGAQIAGTRIPGWKEIRTEMARLAESLPFLPYIGWDIAVGPEGPLVIEANANSGIELLQLEAPLLADERLRRFFRNRGVISPRRFERAQEILAKDGAISSGERHGTTGTSLSNALSEENCKMSSSLPTNGKKTIVGYATGVFDLFHVGHLNILRRASEACDYLIVGVTTDEVAEERKGWPPVIPYDERTAIVNALEFVDEVVPQDKVDPLHEWEKIGFDVTFKGSDWKGTEFWERMDRELRRRGARVHFFPYTETTSSTLLRAVLEQRVLATKEGAAGEVAP